MPGSSGSPRAKARPCATGCWEEQDAPCLSCGLAGPCFFPCAFIFVNASFLSSASRAQSAVAPQPGKEGSTWPEGTCGGAGVTARCWRCFGLRKHCAPQLWGLPGDFPSHFQLQGRSAQQAGEAGEKADRALGTPAGTWLPRGRTEPLPQLLPLLPSPRAVRVGCPLPPGVPSSCSAPPLGPARAAAPSPQPQPDFPRRPRARFSRRRASCWGESEGGEGSGTPCPWGRGSMDSSGIALSTRCAPSVPG